MSGDHGPRRSRDRASRGTRAQRGGAALLLTGALMIALMIPAAALAQGDSTCQAYNPQTCNALSTTQHNAAPTSSGSLPFTGLDIILLVVGGGTLLVTGLVVRAVSRRVG